MLHFTRHCTVPQSSVRVSKTVLYSDLDAQIKPRNSYYRQLNACVHMMSSLTRNAEYFLIPIRYCSLSNCFVLLGTVCARLLINVVIYLAFRSKMVEDFQLYYCDIFPSDFCYCTDNQVENFFFADHRRIQAVDLQMNLLIDYTWLIPTMPDIKIRYWKGKKPGYQDPASLPCTKISSQTIFRRSRKWRMNAESPV